MVHRLWHVLVLGVTLLAAAGVTLALLGPLLFEQLPARWPLLRASVLGVGLLAAALLLLEWRGIH